MPEALDIKKIDKNSDGLIDKKELADLAKKVKKPEIKKELATKLNLEENLQLKELVLKTLELVVSQIKQKKDTEYENGDVEILEFYELVKANGIIKQNEQPQQVENLDSKLNKLDISGKNNEIESILKNHTSYKLGAWKQINLELATGLGIEIDGKNEGELIEFGKKFQNLIGSKEDDGKIGVKTMKDAINKLGIKDLQISHESKIESGEKDVDIGETGNSQVAHTKKENNNESINKVETLKKLNNLFNGFGKIYYSTINYINALKKSEKEGNLFQKGGDLLGGLIRMEGGKLGKSDRIYAIEDSIKNEIIALYNQLNKIKAQIQQLRKDGGNQEEINKYTNLYNYNVKILKGLYIPGKNGKAFTDIEPLGYLEAIKNSAVETGQNIVNGESVKVFGNYGKGIVTGAFHGFMAMVDPRTYVAIVDGVGKAIGTGLAIGFGGDLTRKQAIEDYKIISEKIASMGDKFVCLPPDQMGAVVGKVIGEVVGMAGGGAVATKVAKASLEATKTFEIAYKAANPKTTHRFQVGKQAARDSLKESKRQIVKDGKEVIKQNLEQVKKIGKKKGKLGTKNIGNKAELTAKTSFEEQRNIILKDQMGKVKEGDLVKFANKKFTVGEEVMYEGKKCKIIGNKNGEIQLKIENGNNFSVSEATAKQKLKVPKKGIIILEDLSKSAEKIKGLSKDLQTFVSEGLSDIQEAYKLFLKTPKKAASNLAERMKSMATSSKFATLPKELAVDIKAYFGKIYNEIKVFLSDVKERRLKKGEINLERQAKVEEHFKINVNGPRRNPEKLPYNKVKRSTDVVSLGDLHGDLKSFKMSLKNHGLIDNNGNWIGGNKKFVQTGDIFDRGSEGLKILDEIKKLKSQGADIELIIGNHEDMMLRGMLGDNSALNTWAMNEPGKEFDRLFGFEVNKSNLSGNEVFVRQQLRNYFKGHEEIFTNMKLVEQVDDVLYLHSELSTNLLQAVQKYGIDGINKIYQNALKQAFNGDISLLKNISGPPNGEFYNIMWSREVSSGNLGKQQLYEITNGLKEQGINAVIHGHTPISTGKISNNTINGVKIINGDIAMSSGMSEGSQAGGFKIASN